MTTIHLCSACYTDLEHHRLQRCLPKSHLWRIAWAEGLGAGVDPVVLNSFAASTVLTYFIDIRHREAYIKTINILLDRMAHFDPTFGGGTLMSYALWGHRDGCYGHCVETCPAVAALMADPRIQAAGLGGEAAVARRLVAVGRCKALKGELVERAWHPDRVWNWCFDEDEKREIGAGFAV